MRVDLKRLKRSNLISVVAVGLPEGLQLLELTTEVRPELENTKTMFFIQPENTICCF